MIEHTVQYGNGGAFESLLSHHKSVNQIHVNGVKRRKTRVRASTITAFCFHLRQLKVRCFSSYQSQSAMMQNLPRSRALLGILRAGGEEDHGKASITQRHKGRLDGT